MNNMAQPVDKSRSFTVASKFVIACSAKRHGAGDEVGGGLGHRMKQKRGV